MGQRTRWQILSPVDRVGLSSLKGYLGYIVKVFKGALTIRLVLSLLPALLGPSGHLQTPLLLSIHHKETCGAQPNMGQFHRYSWRPLKESTNTIVKLLNCSLQSTSKCSLW